MKQIDGPVVLVILIGWGIQALIRRKLSTPPRQTDELYKTKNELAAI